MIPILPRQMLWKEKHPLPTDLQKYISDIKANIGWNYSAELVMSMAYYLISLTDKYERPLNKFFTKAVNERFGGCLFWKPFKHRFERLKKEKQTVKYSFIPQPVEVEWLKDKYVHWNTITCNYNLICIEKVVYLWKSVDDRREVVAMINNSMDFGTPSRNAAYKAYIRQFMDVYLMADDSTPIWKCAATLLSKKDVEQLSTLNTKLSTQFHMYPDQDVPGERLFLQLKEVLPSLVRHQLPPGCKDFGEHYASEK
jgi:hypothetical protein